MSSFFTLNVIIKFLRLLSCKCTDSNYPTNQVGEKYEVLSLHAIEAKHADVPNERFLRILHADNSYSGLVSARTTKV